WRTSGAGSGARPCAWTTAAAPTRTSTRRTSARRRAWWAAIGGAARASGPRAGPREGVRVEARAHDAAQLLRRERLLQVLERPVLVREAGQEDHRDAGALLAEAPRELRAVDPRHDDVGDEQRDVAPMVARELQGALAVPGLQHLVAGLAQHARGEQAHHLLVL